MLHDRSFRCPACGQLMVFGAARCGACDEEAPIYNLPRFWHWLYAGCAGFALLLVCLAIL